MKRILLKISGDVFSSPERIFCLTLLETLVAQIDRLRSTHHFHFVVGGGNIIRGSQLTKTSSLRRTTADTIGMIATVINGLLLQDALERKNIPTKLITPTALPGLSSCYQTSENNNNTSLIFAGGIGLPFFSTDTNAVIRTKQLELDELWKGSKEAFIYTKDPRKNHDATPLINVSYRDALEQKLNFMDSSALLFAQEHKLIIRFFDIFSQNSIYNVATNNNVGSLIT